jgi:DNA-binding XRE family transcriptional regulator
MAHRTLPSHLRAHRKESGLSQQELAQLIGYLTEDAVMRHEQATSIPPLVVALAYEAIFQTSVSELFPGIYQSIEQGVELRLRSMQIALQTKSASSRDAKLVARKLEWLCGRRAGTTV